MSDQSQNAGNNQGVPQGSPGAAPEMVDLLNTSSDAVADEIAGASTDTLVNEADPLLAGVTFDPDYYLGQLAQDPAPTEPEYSDQNFADPQSSSPVVGQQVQAEGKGRAQERIQNLVSEKKALTEQMQQMQQQMQYTQQQMQTQMQQSLRMAQMQAQQQFAALEQQNKLLQEQLAGVREAKEDENLSYEDKFKKTLLKQQQEILQKQVESQLQPYREQLSQWQVAMKDHFEKQQQAALVKKFEAETAEAVGEITQDLTPEDRAQLSGFLTDWTMTAAASWRQPPKAVVPEVKKSLDSYFKARLNSLKQQRAKGQAAPPAAPPVAQTGASGVRGNAVQKYTRDQIRAAGYENYFEASRDGFQRIRKTT
jgi:hypothetical protein